MNEEGRGKKSNSNSNNNNKSSSDNTSNSNSTDKINEDIGTKKEEKRNKNGIGSNMNER